MSNNDDSIVMDVEKVIDEEPIKPKKVKVKKPRKPMTPEHKEKLLKSLKKAREQSALKRGLKSQAKKIIKAADEAETNDIIRKSLLVKAKAEEDPRDIEIKKLRAKLDGLTLQDVIKKPKPKPKPKVIIEEDTFEPIDEPDIVTPTPTRPPTPTPTPPPPIPIPVVKPKVFKSTRGSKLKRY